MILSNHRSLNKCNIVQYILVIHGMTYDTIRSEFLVTLSPNINVIVISEYNLTHQKILPLPTLQLSTITYPCTMVLVFFGLLHKFVFFPAYRPMIPLTLDIPPHCFLDLFMFSELLNLIVISDNETFLSAFKLLRLFLP